MRIWVVVVDVVVRLKIGARRDLRIFSGVVVSSVLGLRGKGRSRMSVVSLSGMVISLKAMGYLSLR